MVTMSGVDAVALVAPQGVAGAAEAGLHLVGDERRRPAGAPPRRPAEDAGRVGVDAVGAEKIESAMRAAMPSPAALELVDRAATSRGEPGAVSPGVDRSRSGVEIGGHPGPSGDLRPSEAEKPAVSSRVAVVGFRRDDDALRGRCGCLAMRSARSLASRARAGEHDVPIGAPKLGSSARRSRGCLPGGSGCGCRASASAGATASTTRGWAVADAGRRCCRRRGTRRPRLSHRQAALGADDLDRVGVHQPVGRAEQRLPPPDQRLRRGIEARQVVRVEPVHHPEVEPPRLGGLRCRRCLLHHASCPGEIDE